MNSEQWTNLFFSQHPPDWIHSVSENERSFKTFDHKRKWLLWRSAAEGRYATADRIQVLWLLVKSHQGYRRKYVAKVFPEYTEREAQLQLKRVPFPCSLKDVRDELDPFLNEARVFQRIEERCDASQKTYFPRFQGVVTDLDNSKFRSGYFNQRAIILEALRPDLSSRRILAPRNGDVNEHVEAFSRRLRDIKPELSPFEIEYYSSLSGPDSSSGHIAQSRHCPWRYTR